MTSTGTMCSQNTWRFTFIFDMPQNQLLQLTAHDPQRHEKQDFEHGHSLCAQHVAC